MKIYSLLIPLLLLVLSGCEQNRLDRLIQSGSDDSESSSSSVKSDIENQNPSDSSNPPPTSSDSNPIVLTGTVTYIDIEGGFYGIIGDNGKHYDPINLGQSYAQKGLKIRFQAKIRSDLASFHMWGDIIEIIKMEKL